ncbi:MAG: cell division protein FtsA [Candidatus Gracilibacteria bacterium]|nr:cell division protein FtsA [Candidatus Gracilibacteria bacterium]MDD3120440.1 cell division protein FtsA [Candidatus Gracilibacteria bacterium]
MSNGDSFTAIDIGSHRIKTIIGVFEDKNLKILGVGVSQSNGVRKGNVLDMEQFKDDIENSLGEAEKMTGEMASQVYLSVSGTGIDTYVSSGIVAISGNEVTESDINRALDMAQNGFDFSNKEILKVIPEEFSCDLESGIKNPIGMLAKKLEVKAHIFTIGTNIISNIKRGIYDSGVEVADVYPSILTASEAVLLRRQKELGVVCVDIGASTTGVSVYEEGNLIHSAIIPIGGENVTSDVALGLRVSIDLAEKLKVEYGNVMFCKEDGIKDEEIDLSKLSKIETGTVSKKYLSEIIRARYTEILYFVNDELKKVGKNLMLPEGAVITGGGAKMKGLLDLSREVLKLPATIGVPEDSDYIAGTSVADPAFASVIGTVLLAQKYGVGKGSLKLNFSPGSFLKSIKNLFSKIVP